MDPDIICVKTVSWSAFISVSTHHGRTHISASLSYDLTSLGTFSSPTANSLTVSHGTVPWKSNAATSSGTSGMVAIPQSSQALAPQLSNLSTAPRNCMFSSMSSKYLNPAPASLSSWAAKNSRTLISLHFLFIYHSSWILTLFDTKWLWWRRVFLLDVSSRCVSILLLLSACWDSWPTALRLLILAILMFLRTLPPVSRDPFIRHHRDLVLHIPCMNHSTADAMSCQHISPFPNESQSKALTVF